MIAPGRSKELLHESKVWERCPHPRSRCSRDLSLDKERCFRRELQRVLAREGKCGLQSEPRDAAVPIIFSTASLSIIKVAVMSPAVPPIPPQAPESQNRKIGLSSSRRPAWVFPGAIAGSSAAATAFLGVFGGRGLVSNRIVTIVR